MPQKPESQLSAEWPGTLCTVSELCKAEKELYFYNKGFKCDFIIKNGDHSLEALQVCHEITDRNEKREVGGLQKIAIQYPTVSKTIITRKQPLTA